MPNLEQHNPRSVKIGDIIKFQTVDPNDTVLYSGTVVAVTDYLSARAYADVAATHQAMLQGNSLLNPDISLYRFIIVECYDGIRRPFAYEIDGTESWFKYNTVEIIEVGKNWRVKLFNASSEDAAMAVRILREQGYVCKLEEV